MRGNSNNNSGNGSNNDDYYSILNVDPQADSKTIRKAYLKQSLKYHPDKNVNDPDTAKLNFVRIGEAYEVLSDPVQRAAYDRYRRSATAGASASAHASGTNHFRPTPPPTHTQSQHNQHDHCQYDDQRHYSQNNTKYESTSQSTSTTGASFQHQEQKYRSYREAFDATMAGLSEEELRDVMGAAALIGSIVGGLAGSRLMGQHAGGGGGGGSALVRTVGAMIGSHVASRAATSLVATAHQQSTQRAALDQERRTRSARGETAPDDREEGMSIAQAWKELAQETVRQFQKGLTKPNHMNNNNRQAW